MGSAAGEVAPSDVERPSAVDAALWALHVRFRQHRRSDDRTALVERYAPVAATLARRFHREQEAIEDLRQVALEGLLLALDRFDPERGIPFFGFAMPTIVGTIKSHFRDTGWALRVPREVHELAPTVAAAEEQLAQDLGRPATRAEVSDLLGIDERRLIDIQMALRARSTQSIDEPVRGTDIVAELVDERDRLRSADQRLLLHSALRRLDAADRELVSLYYADGLAQTTIAERRGCSQMQISRELRRVLTALRSYMRDES